jgi:hypothetical protein
MALPPRHAAFTILSMALRETDRYCETLFGTGFDTDAGRCAMADLQQRFSVPLYSVSEAARYVGVPVSTFTTWGRGYVRRRPSGVDSVGIPIVTFVGDAGEGAVVPFIGLAEGLVLAAFRRAGVPLQRVRPALQRIQDELGVEHALASRRLYTDGAEVLYDFAEESGDTPEGRSARELVVIRHGQRVFAEVVEAYLHRVEFARDGYVRLIRLPQYRSSFAVMLRRLPRPAGSRRFLRVLAGQRRCA